MKKNQNYHRYCSTKYNYPWIKYIFFFGFILLTILVALLAKFVTQKARDTKIEKENNMPYNITKNFTPLPITKETFTNSITSNTINQSEWLNNDFNFFSPTGKFQSNNNWSVLMAYLSANREAIKQSLIKQKISPNRDKNAKDNYFTIPHENEDKSITQVPIKVLKDQFINAKTVPYDFLPINLQKTIYEGAEDGEEYVCLVYSKENAIRLLNLFSKMRKQISNMEEKERRFQEDIINRGEQAITEALKNMAGISILDSHIIEQKKISQDFGPIVGVKKFNRISNNG